MMVVATLLGGLAVALAMPPCSERRLKALIGGSGEPLAAPRRQLRTAAAGPSAAVLAAVATWAVVGGLMGAAAAVSVGLVAHQALRVAAQHSAAAPDAVLVRDAPLALDLLAACLAAGAPIPGALTGVGEAVGGRWGGFSTASRTPPRSAVHRNRPGHRCCSRECPRRCARRRPGLSERNAPERPSHQP